MQSSPLNPHGVPNALATAAARQAVALVTERYVKEDFDRRRPPAQSDFDPSATIQRVVGAALQTGLPASDVASGVMSGAFNILSFDAMGPADEELLRRTAATVAWAVAAHGGDVNAAVDGILDAATRIAERARSDYSLAIAAAGVGIVLVLRQEGRVV